MTFSFFVWCFNVLAFVNINTSVTDSNFSHKNCQLSVEEKFSHLESEACSFKNNGASYSTQGKYIDAINSYNKALDIYTQLNNKKEQAICLLIISNQLKKISKYDEALSKSFKALELSTDIKDSLFIAKSNYSLAMTYYEKDELLKSKNHLEVAVKYFSAKNNKNGIIDSNNQLGLILIEDGNFNEALDYFFDKLDKSILNDNVAERASALKNIGLVHSKKNNFKEAINFQLKAYELLKDSNDVKTKCFLLNTIGVLYLETNDFDNSEKYLNEALILALSSNLLNDISTSHFNLYSLYSRIDKPNKALKNYVLYSNYQDSLNAINTNDKISGIEAKYLISQKDKEIDILIERKQIDDYEARKQKHISYAFFMGFIFILIILIILIIQFKLKQKTNKLLKQQKDEIIAQSEKLFELSIIADQTDNAIMIMDNNGDFKWLNKGFTTLYGYTLDDYIGSKGGNLTLTSSHSNIKQIISDCLETKKTIVYINKHITKNGKSIWLQTNITPIIDENGNVIKLAAIESEVTSLIEAEKRISDTNKKLIDSESNLRKVAETKDKFFSIIAHDIKNPFGIILGYSDLIIEDFKDLDKDTILKYIKTIHSSSEKLFQLLEQLLLWSRAQNGSLEFIPERIALSRLVNNNITILHSNADSKNIKVINRIPDDLSIFADELMLNTIFRNLISNAIKFSEKNKEITIDASRINGHTQIEVKDQGIGINENDITKLFKSNFNSSTVGTYNEKGSGIGLSLCHEFTKRHNGNIWVESETNKGSAFFFTIPNN